MNMMRSCEGEGIDTVTIMRRKEKRQKTMVKAEKEAGRRRRPAQREKVRLLRRRERPHQKPPAKGVAIVIDDMETEAIDIGDTEAVAEAEAEVEGEKAIQDTTTATMMWVSRSWNVTNSHLAGNCLLKSRTGALAAAAKNGSM